MPNLTVCCLASVSHADLSSVGQIYILPLVAATRVAALREEVVVLFRSNFLNVFRGPEKIEVALTELRVFSANDTVVVADDAASTHLAKLDQTDAIITSGRDFLCASQKETDFLSCQFVSPYPGSAVLVVYCDASECKMPSLAMNEQLVISASWAHSGGSQVEATSKDILQKIQQIHDFLDPLTSGL